MTDESGLSIAGALTAFAGAAVLAVILYYLVGFPANVPLALGVAVLSAEVLEAVRRHSSGMRRIAVTALFHGVLAACAAWLGVVLVRAAGWIG